MKIIARWQLMPWLIMAISGTASFARLEQIQNEIRRQQAELVAHNVALTQQLKVNEVLRSERAAVISDAIVKQCVENYRIDGKLAKLGMELLSVPSLDKRAKSALADFAAEIAQNQGELQCSNPLQDQRIPPK